MRQSSERQVEGSMTAPRKFADVLAELMAKRGYSRQRSRTDLADAWRTAAGELIADHSRPGLVRRGTLEVIVTHSALLQELSFQKGNILAKLQELAPQEKISELRFRVGPTE